MRSIRAAVVIVGSLVVVVTFGLPSTAANPSVTSVKTNPDADEERPAASATFLAWSQNSVAAPNHWDVRGQVRDQSAAPWKVNAPRTLGFGSSPIAGTTSIIYQQIKGAASDLYFSNLATRTRTKLPGKVDSAAWEYGGVASSKYVAFIRSTSTARALLLFNRSTRTVTTIASVKPKCTFCLRPNWVGTSHMIYEQCTRGFECKLRVWTTGGSIGTVPNPDGHPYSQYGGAMDEATGNIYYIRSTAYCGLFVEMRRTNLSDLSTFSTIYDFPEGIDGNHISLAPNSTVSTDTDLLFSQYDCIENNSDIYQIESVNTL